MNVLLTAIPVETAFIQLQAVSSFKGAALTTLNVVDITLHLMNGADPDIELQRGQKIFSGFLQNWLLLLFLDIMETWRMWDVVVSRPQGWIQLWRIPDRWSNPCNWDWDSTPCLCRQSQSSRPGPSVLLTNWGNHNAQCTLRKSPLELELRTHSCNFEQIWSWDVRSHRQLHDQIWMLLQVCMKWPSC